MGKPEDVPKTSERVQAALLAVGGCSKVPVVVTRVLVEASEPPAVFIEIDLLYRMATPVCCAEPGCYIKFLGLKRSEVPEAVQRALSLSSTPNVTIAARLDYEAGYEHTELRYPAVSFVATYEPVHFRAQ